MAVTVTSDLTDISACNSTTDGGTHYRLGGTNTGNPGADTDAMVQGGGCIANKMGSTIAPTDVGGHFNHTSTFDLTNKHLFHWRQIVTAGNMETKANKGVAVGLTNTSTTSTTAWSTTNYKLWYLDGKDTVPTAQGWIPYVLDPTSTADLSAGTLTLTTVKNVGMVCRQVSTVTTTVSNQFYDAIRAGTGLTATASSGADVITFASLYAADSNSTNAWGIITQIAGIYYGAGKMTIGATGQANACNFTDSNQVLVWRNQKTADDLYEFSLEGASGNKTTMTLTECVVRGQSAKKWSVTCDANSDFKAYGCALANILTATLSAGSVLSDTSVSLATTVETNGATISGCSFTASKLKVDSTTEMAAISDCAFASPGTGHGIELSVAGTYSFDGLTFTGYAGSNGSTGNEAVYVNVASGSVTINITGGSTPTYRTAGATVTVVNSATKTFTGLPVGTEVRVRRGSKTLATDGNVTTGSYVYSYTPDDKAAVVQFTLPGTVFEDISVILNSTNQELPVTSAPDPSYSVT